MKRIVYNKISENELLGILKDKILTKKINGIAWPGNYLDNKSQAFPIGIQLWAGEKQERMTKNDCLVIQITSDDGLWQVDDEDIIPLDEVKLSKATDEQLEEELERRKVQSRKEK